MVICVIFVGDMVLNINIVVSIKWFDCCNDNYRYKCCICFVLYWLWVYLLMYKENVDYYICKLIF